MKTNKAKKLLSRVFSKEELVEMIIEVLKKDEELYSNSDKLKDVILSNLDKKEDEIFHELISRDLNKEEVPIVNYFKQLVQYEKIEKELKLKLLKKCRAILYEEMRD